MVKHKDFTTCHLTPLTAIRLMCRGCVGYQMAEVERCTATKCPLYPYRMRSRPNKKSVLLNTLEEGLAINKREES